jgi:hypothetical protein
MAHLTCRADQCQEKEENDGKKLAAYRQNVDRETHHCTFVTAVCTLRPSRVPIIPTTFDTTTVITISEVLSKLWWL